MTPAYRGRFYRLTAPLRGWRNAKTCKNRRWGDRLSRRRYSCEHGVILEVTLNPSIAMMLTGLPRRCAVAARRYWTSDFQCPRPGRSRF
jgi:hypothetical protein